MADQNITELPVKTSSGMTSSDYMLGIDSAEGYQMLIKDLGDYIIRNVQVNTIAGANQTLKSALDTLNSNTNRAIISNGTDLDSLVLDSNNGKNKYYRGYSITSMTNHPSSLTTSFPFALDVIAIGGYSKQILYVYSSNSVQSVWERNEYTSGGTTVWSDWTRNPTRSEVDALNSNVTNLSNRTYIPCKYLNDTTKTALQLVTNEFENMDNGQMHALRIRASDSTIFGTFVRHTDYYGSGIFTDSSAGSVIVIGNSNGSWRQRLVSTT